MTRIKYWLHTLRRLRRFFKCTLKSNRLKKSGHLSKAINAWITTTLAIEPYEANYNLIQAMLNCDESRSIFEIYVRSRNIDVDLTILENNISEPHDDECRFIILQKSINIDDIHFTLTDIHKQLIQRYGQAKVVSACLRYRCFTLDLNDPGHQWSLDPNINPGWPEAFAGPFNIRSPDILWCGAFLDDQELGSLGSFFMLDLERISPQWVVDPPFIEVILELAARKIVSCNVKFLFCMIKWTDSEAYRILSNHTGLTEITHQRGNHYYYDQKQPMQAPFDSVHFTNY